MESRPKKLLDHVRDGDKELAEALNAIIQQLQTEGFIQALAFRLIPGAY